VRRLLTACRYLTVLPLPRSDAAGDLGRAAGWFPVVGLILGLGLAAAGLVAAWLGPPLLAAAVVVTLWALGTGGLHLDGLADAADGLGGGFSADEALAIMRDPGTGAFGVTAVVLVLAIKIAALAGLPPEVGWRVLLLAPVASRVGPLVLARLCPPARAEGAGHAFALAVGPAELTAAALVAAATGLALLGPWGLLPLGLVAASAAGFAGYLRRRLGGLTGDCLGAQVEAGEALVLAALAVLAHGGRL
jgi:adenosylcobinamide-GDP ribazoletransferase